jgi:hypothetical protein
MAERDLEAETLRRMYLDEGMTIAAIARTLRVRKQIVCAALAQWNIPRRRRGPRRHFPQLPYPPGALRQLIRRKGMCAVAQSLGVATDVLYAAIERDPLPRGTKRRVDDAAVWAAYQAGVPIADMRVQFRCSDDTIRRSLRRSFLRAAAPGNQSGC